jgi:predicted dienelactone hydrolase
MCRFTALVLLVVAACGSPPAPADPLPFEPAGPDVVLDPTKPGPFPVGVRTVTFEDTGRRKADGTPRQLVTEIWYPAVQSTRGQPTVRYDITEYFTEAQRASIGVGVVPLLETDAVRDAEPARSHGPFPLVIFSHGQASVRWQSTFYTVLLASHGYVVVSTDHEGGTLYDVVREGLQNVAAGVEYRPADVIYLLNRLARLRDDDPMAGLLDFEHVGVTGHSFGGLTSLRVAAIDPRVKAIVPQTPPDANLSWLGLQRPVRLGIPVFIQAAHDDRTLKWDEHIAPTIPLMERPWWLLDIVKGGHFTFSDLCAFDLASIIDRVQIDIPGADIRNVLEDGCGPTSPPASVAQPIINHFSIAFFNGTLRGSPGSMALLTQEKADAIAGAAGVAVLDAHP